MEQKSILVGITGGIAAYKSAELVRLIVRYGLEAQVVMTPASTSLITPLTFQSLSGKPVYVELFEQNESRIRHIELANQPSLIVVAPLTANTLGKLAAGIADNLLTTIILASSAPVILVPSMNENMYQQEIVQENIKKVKGYGYYVLEPEEGNLACGTAGRGRMPSPEDIFLRMKVLLQDKKDYAGGKVLVTAGPTREPMDPVRFFSNHSTGKMGFALARAFKERGAQVSLVTGPTDLPLPTDMEVVEVVTADEMWNEVTKRFGDADIVVKAAAVSDYRPKHEEKQKMKKKESITVEMEQTPDILEYLGANKSNQLLVGFAAETEDLLENARKKMSAKNLDIIVANDLTEAEAGFATETNKVVAITRRGGNYEIPLMSKEELSHRLLDIIREALDSS